MYLFLLTASIYKILGSKITIVDESANQTLCVQFSYSFNDSLTPQYKRVRHMDSINLSAFLIFYFQILRLKAFDSTINCYISSLSNMLLYFQTYFCSSAGHKLCPQIHGQNKIMLLLKPFLKQVSPQLLQLVPKICSSALSQGQCSS